MRNVLALLGAGLLAGCCLMHFHVPITEQTQANARTFGSLGQRLLPEDTPPERIAAFRQCLSEAYMEHYGKARRARPGSARTGMRCSGRPSWRRLRHTTIWRPTTFMCGAGNGTKPIRVRLWRRAGHGPGSSLSGAARACFRMRTVTVCSACSRVFPHGVTRRRGSAVAAPSGRHGDAARSRPGTSINKAHAVPEKETVCANVQKHRIP